MNKPTGFARIPCMGLLHPECQRCYFHNREPAICEVCEGASQFEPSDEECERLSERKAALVRFHRKHPQTPEQRDEIAAVLETV